MKLKEIIQNIFSIRNFKEYKLIKLLGFSFKIKTLHSRVSYLEKKCALYFTSFKLILDSAADITKCKPATGNFRKIQLAKLNGLKLILKIFEKHDIKYWLEAGTLIGAYRHKGFIPWDDDIDIGMLREDYLKAYKVLQDELKDTKLSVLIGNAKNVNLDKLVLRVLYDCGWDKFIYADMLPYDFADKDLSKSEIMVKMRNVDNKFFSKYSQEKLQKQSVEIEKFIEDTLTMYEEEGLISDNKENGYIIRAIYATAHNQPCTVHSFEDMYPLSKLEFEGCELSVPKNVLKYLDGIWEGWYGNIMDFPPLHCMCDHTAFKKFNDEEYMKMVDECSEYAKSILSRYE